jgi:uncharacterized protein DUF1707
VSGLPDIRVSDAERESAAIALREHSVAGRLTLEELSDRLDEVYAARTQEELARVERELPPLASTRRHRRRFVAAVFGNAERRARWRVGRRIFVFSVFGDVDLDLRGAELERPDLGVLCFTLFGNVDVYVPEGAELDHSAFIVFGHSRNRGHEPPPRREAPLVSVRALGLFGATDVWRVPGGATGSFRDLIRLAKSRQKELGA